MWINLVSVYVCIECSVFKLTKLNKLKPKCKFLQTLPEFNSTYNNDSGAAISSQKCPRLSSDLDPLWSLDILKHPARSKCLLSTLTYQLIYRRLLTLVRWFESPWGTSVILLLQKVDEVSSRRAGVGCLYCIFFTIAAVVSLFRSMYIFIPSC